MKSKQILSLTLSLLFLFAGHVFSAEKGPDASPEPVVSDIRIRIDQAGGKEAQWKEMARNLIFLRKGEPFSAEKLKQSLEALKLCKKFQNIHVDSQEVGKTLVLLFRMTPFRQIKDIKIRHASPFLERDILNAMTIYIGDAFSKEALPKQEEFIEEIFKREGFIDPQVTVSATEDPEDGHFLIHVDIDRDSYYSVEKLDIRGNRAFSDQRLKLRMKTWMASLLPGGPGRFVEENLRKDIKNLTEFYRGKKYADVAVDFTLEKDPDAREASISVNVSEGPKYALDFEGNKEFWGFTLKKDLALFENGNKNDVGIRKTLKNIKTRYKKAGYLKARVKLKDEVETKKERSFRNLCFVIEEGPQSLVESVQITGNHLFDDKKIRKQILTQPPGTFHNGAYVPEIFEEDIRAIESLYARHGHANVVVKKNVAVSEDEKKASIRLEIEEGVKTFVSSVQFRGLSVLSQDIAYKTISMKQGNIFQNGKIQEDENALASKISEKGYPHVVVRGELSDTGDPSKAAIMYHVEEGPFMKMGEVYYTGNFRTKPKILLNELEIKPEAPFSLVKLLETQRNIRNMKIFDSVKFKTIGLREKADKVNLFVEIEEKKPYFVQVGGGYDTERLIYVNAKGGDLNLFGTNKKIWVEGEYSQIGYQGALGITEPRLLGSRFSATAGIFAEETEELNQDFGTRFFGSYVWFSRKWLKRLNTSLNLQFEQREQFGKDEDDTPPMNSNEFDARSIFIATPSISYDTRDSFISPKKGMFSALSLDISKGLENSLDNFLKYQLDTRFYWTPMDRLTLACKGRVGYIDPFGGSEKVADDQLFFLGGISDVRGFEENMFRYDVQDDPVGGQSEISGSLEARIDMGLNFELATFYDIGCLSDTFDGKDSDGFRSTVG
ncbi:MAG: hypothetical protein DRI57_19090, partial [Deltaproteobacteria bacterium]